MKIVTLLGSPRSGGNSSSLARHLLKTAAGLGADTRDCFELNRLKYRGCQACRACKLGSDACVLKDEATPVLEAVRAADAVVLASPVYFGDLTGQLKTCLDRFYAYLVPDFHTNPVPGRLKVKELIFILTQGNADEQRFADVYPRYTAFLKWMGFQNCRLLRVCGIGPGAGDALPEAALRQAEELGCSLIGA